jgi:hypothetical protein
MHKVPLYNINKNKVLFLWFRWLPPPLCSPVRINKKNIKNGRGSWSQSRPNRFSPKHLYELALTPPKKNENIGQKATWLVTHQICPCEMPRDAFNLNR